MAPADGQLPWCVARLPRSGWACRRGTGRSPATTAAATTRRRPRSRAPPTSASRRPAAARPAARTGNWVNDCVEAPGPPTGIVCTRSALANCSVVPCRRPGSLASAVLIARTRPSGRSGRSFFRFGSGALMCLCSNSSVVPASNGGLPVSRYHSVAPRLYRSDLPVAGHALQDLRRDELRAFPPIRPGSCSGRWGPRRAPARSPPLSPAPYG